MKIKMKWFLSAVGLMVPIAVAHAVGVLSGVGPHILLVTVLECCGFAVLVWALRLRWQMVVLAAILYFPLVFFLIFQIGVRAGYYDFP